MNVICLLPLYYFLVLLSECNCKISVVKRRNADVLSNDNAYVTLNTKHASFVLCVLNTTCFNHTDDQNDRRESNILKIRSFEHYLDGISIETLEVETFESRIDIEMMSKVLSLFFRYKPNVSTVKFCPEYVDETQVSIDQETPGMLSIDEETAVNVLETNNSFSEDEKKYSCINNIFTNDMTRNLTIDSMFTLALGMYDECIALKSTKCKMVIALPCGRGVVCSKVAVFYNVHPCDAEIDAASRQGQGRTGAWSYVIVVLMLVFVLIKAVAKTGATFLRRSRRVQLLPVSNVFGRAPNVSTPLVSNGRPRYYQVFNSPRCSGCRNCEQFEL